MALNRVRCVWAGIPTGPGVSTFYFGSGTTSMAALVSFWNTVLNNVPTGINVTTPNLGDQIDETTGKIIGSWTGSGGATNNGFAPSANYSAPSGLVIDWLTSLVLDGRRRQGRTFVVPLAATAFQPDGTLGAGTISATLGAATTMIAAYAGEFKVFVRPLLARAAKPDNIPPITAKAGHVGAAAQVILGRIPDKAAVLRSRRD